MKAVVYTHSRAITEPGALQDMDMPEPQAPQGHDLLVDVRAVAVNPVDAKQRKRADPKGEPAILGYDATGVVRACGSQVTLFHPGDQVFYAGSINRPGSNAELQLVDERIVGHQPKTLSAAQAASLPLTAITAWEALFDRMGLPRAPEAGGTLLIIGAGGGVGSIAIQIARALTTARVIATASRPETVSWCRELGAHEVIDHSGDMPAQMKALGVAWVERIFGINASGQHWPAMARLVAPQGHICLIDDPGPIDARDIRPKSAALHWELMFTRPVFTTPDIAAQHELLEQVAAMVDGGKLRHTQAQHYGRITAANLIRAHAAMEASTMVGKIVLEGF